LEPTRPPASSETVDTLPDLTALAFDVGYANRIGDLGRAITTARQVVASADETDPKRAGANINLGELLYYAGDLASAEASLQEGGPHLAGAERSGIVAQALLHGHACLATVRADAGELDLAARSVADGEQIARDQGQDEHHHGMFLHVARGKLLELRADLAGAEAAFSRAEMLARRIDWPIDRAHTFLLLARVKHRLGQHAEARALARRARERLRGCPDPGMLRDLLAKTERMLQLDSTRVGVALPTGIDLSEREQTILRLLATELSQREIGAELYVSMNTVKSHVRSIFRKLNVATRAEAVSRGRELDLL
jgi:LuxR family maltose regulon positive regulatory protein